MQAATHYLAWQIKGVGVYFGNIKLDDDWTFPAPGGILASMLKARVF